ncbi:hypothetical protein HQ865_12675 [Mucilaginibacter mali]|uniref:Uncharacterized protein n=1 Tax=Mucilaginibacter mali TaxID=2740462 RepID=A0A7D4TVI2_9SPHI|nr:hypothetical protein [Mucilaginibacter mali]QKJ30575.1 hypothetical protein HQ865_12675 [Mucilaginibacter mali]
METTEPEVKEQALPEEPAMVLSQEAQYYLQQIGKWASFLGIVGFVFCGLFFIMAIFIGSIFAMMSKISPMYAQNPAASAMGPMLSVIYIVFDAIYFILVLYLYQFAVRIKRGIAFVDNAMVTSAFSKLKSFFKAWGIITIVLLSFYALIFVIVAIVGVAASAMH